MSSARLGGAPVTQGNGPWAPPPRRVAPVAYLLLACLTGMAVVMTVALLYLQPVTEEVEGPPGHVPYMGELDPMPTVPEAAGLTLPVRLLIPRIGVSAPMTAVGLEPDGQIEVPPLETPEVVGWYRLGPAPGHLGPAVVLGHVNTQAGPAVFHRLHELRPGDPILVVRTDASLVMFTVDDVEQVGKDEFPTEKVYGSTPGATLRLITCGGVFNQRTGSYTDNIIVYASKVS